MNKRAAKVELTAEYVLRGIKGLADDAEKDADRLKAFELLGKHLKLFTEKHDVTHSFDGQTDEQLEARFRALVVKSEP